MKKWLKLDNAAKIFPNVSTERRTNLYSISSTLYEEVDKDLLQEALNIAIKRFDVYRVRLKKGLFWYYFDENKDMPLVHEENPYVLEMFNPLDSNRYLFRVSYYHCRITLETFHALTDGYGALQFLNAIIYNYLLLKGYTLSNKNRILTNVERVVEESEDSFVKNYQKGMPVERKEDRGMHLKGTLYPDCWSALITGMVPKAQIKTMCTKYNCSITQFLCSVVIYAAYKSEMILGSKKYPFQIFVPVNLRKIFTSKTLRNFSLYVRTMVDLEQELTFDDIINKVKDDLLKDLTKEKLLPRMGANVRSEKMFILRIVPLFIKRFILRIVYNIVSGKSNTFCLSNLGKIEVPNDMKKYMKNVIFANGTTPTAPINMGVTDYNDNIYMTFTSAIIERDLPREFFRFLSDEGLEVIIETNELEVE